MLPSIKPPGPLGPGVPRQQRMFVVPVQNLQEILHNQQQQQQQLQQQQQQQQQQPQQQQQQQQEEEREDTTMQPVRFDCFSALPVKEVLQMFKTPSGVIKRMPPRPQSGTVWRFDNGGSNRDNWKAQLYQWVEPGDKITMQLLALFVYLLCVIVLVA